MEHTPGTDRSRRISARFAIVLCLAVVLVAIPALAFGLPVTTCNPSASYNNIASISIAATTGADPTTYLGTRYRFDAAAMTTISAYPTTATVTLATYGAHTISFFSVDASGGVEATQTKSFSIADTLKPVTISDASVVYLNSATVKLTATDTVTSGSSVAIGSGVAFTWFQLDAAAVTTGTTIATSAYGNHTLKFWSKDVAGNIETTTTVSFFVEDTIKPTTISDVSATYANSAAIHISGTDSVGGSGVAHTYYRLDGGAQTEASTINVNTYGTHSIQFWSVDNAGNEETPITATFFVDDTIAPVTASDAVEDYPVSAHITLTATDVNGSGVAHTNYNLDGAGFVEGTSVNTSVVGTHTLLFYSVDNEGNAEVPKSVTFDVGEAADDTTAPSTTSNAVATYATSPATIHLVATDNAGGSGIASISYKVDGGTTVVVTPPSGVKATAAGFPNLGFPVGHAGGASPANCACHPGIVYAGHGGGAAPASCGCHTLLTPSAAIALPSTHAARLTGCKGCHPSSAPVIMPTTTDNPHHYGQSVGFPGGGDCEDCHTFTVAEETTTPTPVMTFGTDVVVAGTGPHTLEFWSTDVAGNIETPHHTVSFEIEEVTGPDATSITIARSASSVRRGSSFILSGLVTPPELVGHNIQVMVKKPNKAYYSYSSLRTCYLNAGVPSWWYRYTAIASMVPGTYRFYAFVPASTDFLTSVSPVVTVAIR